ncbi:prolyl-tRNA synthetase associated domain-containing protein [Geosporobacter ferrireducens]|uniref:Aminoacyl-tRNA deacylase n=1 Tax=Geosporobacter ferrireducens TaxID=1424294 RepID=A0A1D8GCL7_9FIRM|nr:prolyl-tRNA synthetase associated domain-containing protein [Geosporobacter ferrireducens]AOT68655.1 aminoacyl-tRNA deacylase [Geosporobacter ferrireducens]MTI54130.1 prolyl-tRNA synthetase associated domain-containing protein [Geosporobacter ferrireducens]
MEKEKKVYEVLEALKISYLKYEHIPIYTIEEANQLNLDMQGQHCKNLFVRDKKGEKHYLVIIEESKKVDLKSLSKQIESTNLSFASEERLLRYLGLTPGAVSPFGLVNDMEKHVEVLLDSDLTDLKHISFHPNVNTATITLRFEDFKKFLNWCGNELRLIQV